MNFFKLNPVTRISLSLLAILIAWLLLIELTVGIWPKQDQMLKKLRQTTVENLVINTSLKLQSRDFKGIKKLLDNAISKDSEILSAGIRLKNGVMAVQTANHAQYYKPVSKLSTLDFIHVELTADNKAWGDFEIAFKPVQETSFIDWIRTPTVIATALSVLGILLLFSLYLKKIFHYLDPSSVIPDRVRAAFDAFSEGVLMIDRSGYIVLLNKTVIDWIGEGGKYFGTHISALPWVSSLRLGKNEKYPWTDAMDLQQVVSGMRLDFEQANGEQVNSVINCSPILDANGGVRGCLITVDNITESEKLNTELKLTNDELMKSRLALDKQNEELRKLATKDPLTNCLNRRSFYELAEHTFSNAKTYNFPLSCIMFDIDHFKQVNDSYGHATGDKVIISIAKVAFTGLRVEDLLCRYGGEEFCILLPQADLEIGKKLAERLRNEIELKAGLTVLDNGADLPVTSSFGVSTLTLKIKSLAELIDVADKALYKAKKSGRNRVVAA